MPHHGALHQRRARPIRLALVLALALPSVGIPPPAAAIGMVFGPRPIRGGAPCRLRGARHFQVIVYGDEPAGVMTALELSRQLRQLAGLSRPRIALVTPADVREGLGGTLARSGLAYLDRNQVPRDLWGLLPPFAPSSELYQRFLLLTGVHQIAVDPRRASRAFTSALRREGIAVLPAADPMGAEREGRRLCVLQSRRYGRLGADLFLDASVGADLAHRAGVPFLEGLGPRGLSHESIALGWIFEVQGLTLARLQHCEEAFTRRLLDPRDREAQQWLQSWPAYRSDRRRLLADLLDERGAPRLAYSSTGDSADQQSPALSIAFHGLLHRRPGLRAAPARLDPANIAILGDRLSFNALLFRNSAEQNRQVIAGGGRPLFWMRPVASDVETFFRRLGARRVIWMPELYIRSADQIAHPRQTLGAVMMAAGGVPADRALGTFTYYLDFRGGLEEFLPPAKPTFNFGYRHTLPRELGNLAVLGPSSGFGGLGEGAGRIIELNISVGQGLAIASALALARGVPLDEVDEREVARLMPSGFVPYGRPSGSTALSLFLRRIRYGFAAWLERHQGEPPWPHPQRTRKVTAITAVMSFSMVRVS